MEDHECVIHECTRDNHTVLERIGSASFDGGVRNLRVDDVVMFRILDQLNVQAEFFMAKVCNAVRYIKVIMLFIGARI